MNTRLLKIGIRVWLMETLLAGFNFFVLMNLIYEPRWGVLVAHQIGMSTRIVIIFVLAYFLLRYVKEYNTRDLIVIGLVWLGLEEIFEWGGSFILGRPVEEILVGWNILAGYMWPYVMLAYLLSNLIVGTILHPGKKKVKLNNVRENMNSKIVFIELEKGEETEACRLVIDCFNDFVAPDYSDEGVKEFLKYVNPSSMQERLAHGHFVLVAVYDSLIVGVIEIRSNNHISLLFVKKEYQRRGIAGRLLELAIQRCIQGDNTTSEIDVNSSPYAVKIYEKLGFTRADAEKLVNGIRFIPMKSKLPKFPE